MFYTCLDISRNKTIIKVTINIFGGVEVIECSNDVQTIEAKLQQLTLEEMREVSLLVDILISPGDNTVDLAKDGFHLLWA